MIKGDQPYKEVTKDSMEVLIIVVAAGLIIGGMCAYVKLIESFAKSRLIIPILLTTHGAVAEGGRPLSSPLHW